MFDKVAETIYWNKKGYPVAHPNLRETRSSSCLCTTVCTHPGKAPWLRTSPAELVTCKLSFSFSLSKLLRTHFCCHYHLCFSGGEGLEPGPLPFPSEMCYAWLAKCS